MKIEILLFWSFHVIRTFFLNVRKNAEKLAKSFFRTCRVLCVGGASWAHCWQRGHMETRRFGQKNDGKSRKWEEVKEITGKMWKKEGKRKKGYKNENWRKWEKREKWVRKEEKKREGKVGKPRGRWACYTIPQMSLECCSPFPVRLCLKSDHVRTVSKKKCKIEQSEHRIVTTTVDIKCSTRDMFGESSFRELFTWDGSPDLSGINVRKVRKIITKTWKNDNLMSKIDQKRVLHFRKVSGSKNQGFHFIGPCRFFLGKSDSKKGGGS